MRFIRAVLTLLLRASQHHPEGVPYFRPRHCLRNEQLRQKLSLYASGAEGHGCKGHGPVSNVEADLSNELLAEYAKRRGACTLVKGLRAASDFEKEFQMALINRRLNPNLETLFLPASEKYTYLSSSAVRELGRYGVDLSDWVPREIIEDVKMKWEAGGR